MIYYPYLVKDFHMSEIYLHMYFCFLSPHIFTLVFVCALLSPGHSVRFADMPGKSRKKKKNMKELTPLQAMMLRMAGGWYR